MVRRYNSFQSSNGIHIFPLDSESRWFYNIFSVNKSSCFREDTFIINSIKRSICIKDI